MFAYCMVKYDMEQFLDLEEPAAGESTETGCVRIRMMSDMKEYHESFRATSSLFAVLIEGRGAKATDPRDKVFAVMAMADRIVHPDYQRPVFDVYMEACKDCLNVADVIRLLCSVDHEQPTSGMPSWVPDWSTPRQTVSLGYTGKEHAVYKAAFWDKSFAGYRLKCLKVENDNSLVTKGLFFDTIGEVSGPAGSRLQDLLIEESTTRIFVLECVRMAFDKCKGYRVRNGLFEAFWRTLVAGKDHTGVLKAPTDYADLFALLLDTTNGGLPCFPHQPQFKRKLTLKNLQSRQPRRIYREMQIAFKAAVRGRKFCTTTRRYMGLFPRGTQIGDQVCVFIGGPLPFVIRPRENGGSYLLIGECYVHGLMDGEILKMEDLNLQEVTIV